MATSLDYILFVAQQVEDFGEVRYRKMFGEYMLYIDNKPIFTVCDNTVFVKKYDEIAELMSDAQCGFPYDGAKECYIADIENKELLEKLVPVLLSTVKIPKKKIKS